MEALDAYEKALELEPNFAMAIANKGYVQSLFAYVVERDAAVALLHDAHSNISKGISGDLDYGPKNYFNQVLREIRGYFKNPDFLDTEQKCTGIIDESKSDFQKFYKHFCHNERLYLNPLDKSHKCQAALYDPIILRRFIVDLRNHDRFFEYANYINQIKQEYVLAKFLAAQSFFRDKSFEFINEGVTLINTLDYPAFSIFLDLAKASFRTSYSILDKVAYIANEYLNVGLDPKRLYFQSLSQLGNNKIKEKFSSIKNPFLAAITDLANDFANDYFKKIKETRRAFEHRFKTIHLDFALPWLLGNSPFDIDEIKSNQSDLLKVSEFRETMIDMLRLAKSAIYYVVLMIDWEERRKAQNIEANKIAPLFADEIPDHLKGE